MAAAIKPPPIALALLAIGAFWWLTQRKAGAAAVTGTPQYGQQGALVNPAVQRYQVAPSGVVPQQATPLQSVLQFASQLITSNRSAPASAGASSTNIADAYRYGGPSTGVYGASEIDKMQQAYSYGGPSTGVYGVDPVPSVLTSMIANPWSLAQPELGGYGYSDGAGVADQVVASYAPNFDWDAILADQSNPMYFNY